MTTPTTTRASLPALATVVVVLLLLAALSGPWLRAAAQDTDADDESRLPGVELPPDLARVLRDYEAAWAAGDGARLANLFTRDGFIRDRSWLQGRDDIAARYDEVAGGALKLRAVGYARGERVAHIVGAYGYGEEASQRDGGVFLLALERGPDGRWLIHADLDHGIPRDD